MTAATHRASGTTRQRTRRPAGVAVLALLASALPLAAARQPAATQDVRDPCTLLTKADVEAVLRTPVGEPSRRDSTCSFESSGRSARGITMKVHWSGGETAMEGARLAEQAFRSAGALNSTFGHDNRDVADLGDEARFPLKTLYVLRGDTLLEIDASRCSREQAISLARKALARLGKPPA